MGITRLGEFLKKAHPLLLRRKEATSFKNRRVVVDASNTIYSFLAKTISSCGGTQPTGVAGVPSSPTPREI